VCVLIEGGQFREKHRLSESAGNHFQLCTHHFDALQRTGVRELCEGRQPMILIRVGVLGVFLLQVIACGGDYGVPVGNRQVKVAREFWKPMQNPEPFAHNFIARTNRLGEDDAQQLTVFKYPMRPDEQGDYAIARNVWIDAMVVMPPLVTIQVRVAHSNHWLLSRQSFVARPGFDATEYRPFLPPGQVRAVASLYLDEIRRTQSILEAMTAR